MKKKSIIILASVVVVCALGLLASHLFDWPVNTSSTSGNIAKSSRFSRKTAEGGANNMQELLLADEAYKNGVVAAYYVMQARAEQFDVLVDKSNEVAGGIEEFGGVLKEMNEVKPLIDNVCASMADASSSLSSALSGGSCDDLAQNTTNAALAYTTLQKQNKIADKFINVADKYLEKNEGSNELKFVRDQWMEYQKMTAALNNDEKTAAALSKMGYQLSPEETAATMMSFDESMRLVVSQNVFIAANNGVENNLSESVTARMNELVGQQATAGMNEIVGQQATAGMNEIVGQQATAGMNEIVGQIARVGMNELVGQMFKVGINETFGEVAKVGMNEIVGQIAQVGMNELVGQQSTAGMNEGVDK